MEEIKQTICKRCNRRLRNSKAIELEMGEVCWRKYQAENNHKKLWEDKTEREGINNGDT